MIDRRPALIARCAGAADVAETISFARRHDLLLAVRGGAHNGGGLGTCDDGVVLDLSLMQAVEVDPSARTVRVGGGCTWHRSTPRRTRPAWPRRRGSWPPRASAASPWGVASAISHASTGSRSTTCSRRTSSSPTAPRRARAPRRTRELFWALRGGGGNFGVVTSFNFRAHPVSTVLAGPTLWPLEQAAEVMRFYREFLPAAPRELNGFFATMTVPPATSSPLSCTCAKCARWCGATPARPRRPPSSSRPCRRSGRRSCTGWGRCRSRRCRAYSTASTSRACSGTGARTSCGSSRTRRSSSTSRSREAPDAALDHAPLPDRRDRARHGDHRHVVGYPTATGPR